MELGSVIRPSVTAALASGAAAEAISTTPSRVAVISRLSERSLVTEAEPTGQPDLAQSGFSSHSAPWTGLSCPAMFSAGDEARSGPDPIEMARQAAGRGISAARGHAHAAAEAAANALNEKPRLRGVFHQWAFFVSLGAGMALILLANGSRATIAAAVFAFSLSALLGVSALYHRVTWRPAARRWMRRLDHTMIFVLIAGTYTPFALLVLHGPIAEVVLVAVWACAAAGLVLNLLWWDAPKS